MTVLHPIQRPCYSTFPSCPYTQIRLNTTKLRGHTEMWLATGYSILFNSFNELFSQDDEMQKPEASIPEERKG